MGAPGPPQPPPAVPAQGRSGCCLAACCRSEPGCKFRTNSSAPRLGLVRNAKGGMRELWGKQNKPKKQQAVSFFLLVLSLHDSQRRFCLSVRVTGIFFSEIQNQNVFGFLESLAQ